MAFCVVRHNIEATYRILSRFIYLAEARKLCLIARQLKQTAMKIGLAIAGGNKNRVFSH